MGGLIGDIINDIIEGTATEAYVDAAISGSAGATVWKTPVANLAALPLVDNTAGDARVVLDIDEGRIWDADAPAWVPFVASAHSQNTDTMLDFGQPNQVTSSELHALVGTKLLRFSPEYPGTVFYYDGVNNDPGSEGWNATMEVDGNYRRNFYEWSSSDAGSLQDAEIRLRIEIPSDFTSFQTNAIYVDIKTEEIAITNNAIDAIIQKDGAATASISKTGITSTVAATWYTEQAGTAKIIFTSADLSAFSFAAGDVMNLTIKLYSQNSKYARIGDVTMKYST